MEISNHRTILGGTNESDLTEKTFRNKLWIFFYYYILNKMQIKHFHMVLPVQ